MNIRHNLISAILFAFLLLPLAVRTAEYPELLRFSLTPPGEEGAGKFESEHAPLPKREYWLLPTPLSSGRGYLLHPDDSFQELAIIKRNGASLVSFPSPWKSDPMHGPNSVYVFDREVVGETLRTRTAKWIVIHHNCAWGHPYRFDEKRLTPRGLNRIPLEIVPGPLWDGNFHVNTETGSTLTLRVLSYGRPVENARITVISARGWQKEIRTDAEGKAVVQLIRDYYPEGWENFDRTHLEPLLFVARVEREGRGVHEGRPYAREILTTTLPWRYKPARADYTSLASGLAIGFISIALGLTAVLFYRERRRKPARRYGFHE